MYNTRNWLNAEGSASTGSIVCYHGITPWKVHEGDSDNITFLEVADCREKVRLHKCDNDTMEEFISKVRLLAKSAQKFADYLETRDEEA